MFTPASVSVVNVASTTRISTPPLDAASTALRARHRVRPPSTRTQTLTQTSVGDDVHDHKRSLARSRATQRVDASARSNQNQSVTPNGLLRACASSSTSTSSSPSRATPPPTTTIASRSLAASRRSRRLASDHASRAAGHVLKRPRGRRAELPARRLIGRSVRVIWYLHTTFVIVFRTFLRYFRETRVARRTNA